MKFNLMLFTMVSALISNGIHAEEQVQNVPHNKKNGEHLLVLITAEMVMRIAIT